MRTSPYTGRVNVCARPPACARALLDCACGNQVADGRYGGAAAQVNSGLLKMYQVEVLSKVPIMQHFLFGSLLDSFPDLTLPVYFSAHWLSDHTPPLQLMWFAHVPSEFYSTACTIVSPAEESLSARR